MTITINLTIQAEPDDLVALGAMLTAAMVGATRSTAAFAPNVPALPTAPPDEPPSVEQFTSPDDSEPLSVEPPAQPDPSAGDRLAEQPVQHPPAKVAPQPNPTVAGPPRRKPVPSAAKKVPKSGQRTVLPLDEYDVLVRSEMKRLSMEGRLPNRRLWDEERNPRLPTLKAVQDRYKCDSLDALAAVMGLEPPLRNHVYVPDENGHRQPEEVTA